MSIFIFGHAYPFLSSMFHSVIDVLYYKSGVMSYNMVKLMAHLKLCISA